MTTTNLTKYATDTETHLAALERAESEGLTIGKYADPIEPAAQGLSATKAARIADEDPSLIYVTTAEITADTVTDEQIEALLSEAAEAGDEMQVAYCRLALGGTPKIALNTTPYGARIECARVIEGARIAAE